MWHGMFDLTKNYVKSGMTAYVELQEKEFADQDKGYTFSAHQQEVGTGYFDAVNNCIVGDPSTSAMDGSTEEEQF
jgi:isocitrate lyase